MLLHYDCHLITHFLIKVLMVLICLSCWHGDPSPWVCQGAALDQLWRERSDPGLVPLWRAGAHMERSRTAGDHARRLGLPRQDRALYQRPHRGRCWSACMYVLEYDRMCCIVVHSYIWNHVLLSMSDFLWNAFKMWCLRINRSFFLSLLNMNCIIWVMYLLLRILRIVF